MFFLTVFIMQEITLLYIYSCHEFLQTNLSSGTLIYRSASLIIKKSMGKFTILLKSMAY